MKTSDLKIGDHYKLPGYPAVFRLIGPMSSFCAVGGMQLKGPVIAGETLHWSQQHEDREVEIVPMPAPYVIGKAYRTRSGEKRQYMGKKHGQHRFDGRVYGPKSGCTGYGYFLDTGFSTCNWDPADIMGEWIEGTSTTKDNNMDKRPLPTVALDQIFQALVEKKACWASAGPLALAKRLEQLAAKVTPSLITLRTLNVALTQGHIGPSDFVWVYENLPGIRPEGLNPYPSGAELSKRLDEWENPAPRGVRRVDRRKRIDCSDR